MLQPKRTKFRKQHKMRNRGYSYKNSYLRFGSFGLQALTHGRLTSRQIEAARRSITNHIQRSGKLWIRVFPDKPITNKPLASRMGKGKGIVEYWVAQVKPGNIIYELEGVSEELAKAAFLKASSKLPILTKFFLKW